jgi:hypothetical protein
MYASQPPLQLRLVLTLRTIHVWAGPQPKKLMVTNRSQTGRTSPHIQSRMTGQTIRSNQSSNEEGNRNIQYIINAVSGGQTAVGQFVPSLPMTEGTNRRDSRANKGNHKSIQSGPPDEGEEYLTCFKVAPNANTAASWTCRRFAPRTRRAHADGPRPRLSSYACCNP